jgi:quinol monooxygenase YgiN
MGKSMSKLHTVIVVLDAKPGKEKELESALQAVVQPSRSEKACLEYRLHKNKDNASQFILYETWENQEKHQQQFEKPYIKNLAEKLEHLIADSYQAFSAEQI